VRPTDYPRFKINPVATDFSRFKEKVGLSGSDEYEDDKRDLDEPHIDHDNEGT